MLRRKLSGTGLPQKHHFDSQEQEQNPLGWALYSLGKGGINNIDIPQDSMALVFSEKGENEFTTSYESSPAKLAFPEYKILAFPRANWCISGLKGPGILRVMLIKLDVMHQLIGASYANAPGNAERFRMPDQPLLMSAKMKTAILDLFHCEIIGACGLLYRESKIMEFFSLMLLDLQKGKPSIEECPFLEDDVEVKKLEEARNILIREYDQANKIRDLARKVGTNEYKLKVGFKHLFGSSVHNFLIDQRMENARYLLLKKKHNVGEISQMVGYSNPSHFIEAFKKKYGLTPKKMLAS